MSRKKPRGTRKAPKVNYRRRDEEFAGLKVGLHPKTRWEYLDSVDMKNATDYVNKLNDEEKKFLSKFIDEYYGASLAPADDDELWKGDFHSTPELRKECMDRNNARNRDMYTILRTRGMVEDIKQQEVTSQPDGEDVAIDNTINERSIDIFHEDTLIELLDRNEEINVILEKAEEQALETPSPQVPPTPRRVR